MGETPVDELVSMARILAATLRSESLPFVEVRRAASTDRNYGPDLLEVEDPGALEEWTAIARGDVTAEGFARETA